jgi:arylsulfatase A-like enzyme
MVGHGGSVRWAWLIPALAAAGALAALIAREATRGGSGTPRVPDVERLGAAMRVEDVLVNLSAPFDVGAIVEQNAGLPASVGNLQPGGEWRVGGRGRQAIITPPPATVRYRMKAPVAASLRFGIGVEGRGRREPGARGVTFSVGIDGQRVFERALNPGATRHDRRWFDEAVALAPWAGREVEIALRTEAQPGAGPLAGTPGWSHVRIVRERSNDRRQATATAPNVLVLLVDTLRADRLGCYGANPSPSPVLDGIAAAGTVFEETIAQSAWTLPSVASILTGLHPRSHGVLGVLEDGRREAARRDRTPGDRSYLADAIPTLAERAQDAGITTVAVSANPLVSAGTNLARGFETFVEFGLDGHPPAWRSAREINRAFLDWVTVNGRHRFLAYLHYMDVHDPYDPPAPFRPAPAAGMRARIASGDIHEIAERIAQGDAEVLAPAELAYLRTLYDGQIRYWDAELGTLRDGLATAGLLDRTVLLVTSDHGEEFLEHGRLKHGAHLYEELVRVPLIVSGAGIPRGRTGGIAQGIDVFPTIAALLGAGVPDGLPGRNLLAPGRVDFAVSETWFGAGADGRAMEVVALRTPVWKVIHGVNAGRFEVYDLVRDPTERHDLFDTAAEAPDLVQRLQAWVATAPPAPPPSGADPGLRDKLRALGYLEDARP